MRTPGPIHFNRSYSRLYPARGATDPDVGTRQFIVEMRRGEAHERPQFEDGWDALVCELVILSAALIEVGRFADAGNALIDAEQNLDILIDRIPDGGALGRAHCLASACKYNGSVAYFEIGNDARGIDLLRKARGRLDAIPRELQDDLYASADAPVSQLEMLSRFL